MIKLIRHAPGWRRVNLQGLRMASCARRSCPRRKSTATPSFRATEMGTRSHRREGRRTCIHSNISTLRGIFRNCTEAGREPETWRAWKAVAGIRPSLGGDLQLRTRKAESHVEKEERASTEEDCCFETMTDMRLWDI